MLTWSFSCAPAMLAKLVLFIVESVFLSVCLSFCMQIGKNYGSETDVSWHKCVSWWTLEVTGLSDVWPLTPRAVFILLHNPIPPASQVIVSLTSAKCAELMFVLKYRICYSTVLVCYCDMLRLVETAVYFSFILTFILSAGITHMYWLF